MLVLRLHSKGRKSTRDKANISNPKVNTGNPPFAANRSSADCVQISLGPSTQYIPLRVYHTGGFNALNAISSLSTVSRPWCRHQMETFSALLTLCAGNSPVTGDFPSPRPVKRSFDVFFDLRLNKRLSKQSWGWWFEMPSPSLWRHCNGHEAWTYRPQYLFTGH